MLEVFIVGELMVAHLVQHCIRILLKKYSNGLLGSMCCASCMARGKKAFIDDACLGVPDSLDMEPVPESLLGFGITLKH